MFRNFILRNANILKIYKTLKSLPSEYCTQACASTFRHGNWNVILIMEGIRRGVPKVIKSVKDYSWMDIGLILFTNPSARAGYDTRSIFKRSLTGLSSEFSSPRRSLTGLSSEFSLPRLKNTVCPTILPIAGGRMIGFIPFPRVLVLCEMLSASFRIWTRVAVFISYDDNHYTTGHWSNE